MRNQAFDRLQKRFLPRLPLAIALAFAAYSLALLAYFASQWQRMRIETDTYLVADNQRRVAALGERVEAIHAQAQRLAESPEIRAYLLNRDLGMSLRYGLFANMQAIEDRFHEYSGQAQGTQPKRIVFLDAERQIIADSAPDLADSSFDAQTKEASLVIDVHRKLLIVTGPVGHKGKHEGFVLVFYSDDTLYRNLIVSSASHTELLLTPNGWHIGGAPAAPAFTPAQLNTLVAAPDNRVIPAPKLLHDVAGSTLDNTLLIKTQVLGVPLFLITLVSASQAYGHLASPEILLAAGLTPLLLLFGAMWLDRLHAATLRLQAEKEAAELGREHVEQRNSELTLEIRRREQLEASLQEVTQQLKTIFDLSPDGFISLDRNGKIDYVSPAFLRITGLAESQILGLDEAGLARQLGQISSAAGRFPGFSGLHASAAELGAGVTATVEPGETIMFELAYPARRVIQAGMRLSSAGHVSQVIHFRDITRETEVDRLKSEFLSTAAHELRTPMTSVLGYAEVLLNNDFDAATRHNLVETIHRNAKLMAGLINELLDLARIEARRSKDFKLEDRELTPLIEEIVAAFKPPRDRQAPILAAPDTRWFVRVDPRKLTQAIGNILSNAYKYSPQGGAVRIEIFRAEKEKAENKPAQIGIRLIDEGIGMTSEQLGRIFERFYRADTSGKIPGTGLGMSIVKEIIELLGGTISIESRFGHGTSVTLTLPGQIDIPRPQAL